MGKAIARIGLATLFAAAVSTASSHAQAANHVAKVGSVAPEGTPWAVWLADYKRTEKEAAGGQK